jgi:putative LysE/RhtB family amino acid efflux pump
MGVAGVGFGLGFFVAMQLGPMSLLLIRSTLRGGLAVGAAVGLGIAAIDGLYAAAGAAGAGPVLAIPQLRVLLGLLGALVLLAIGARTLRAALRVRSGGEADLEVATPCKAFLTALAGTASNPATIFSWAAIFAAASSAGTGRGSAAAVVLVLGVTAGSLTWGIVLALTVAGLRRRFGQGIMRIADALAGIGLVGFGGVLAYGALTSDQSGR